MRVPLRPKNSTVEGKVKFAAIVAGAGSGTRLGFDRPKALVELGGQALIVHAVRTLCAAGIESVTVTVPAGEEKNFRAVLDAAHLSAQLTEGGNTRQESVCRGLAKTDSQFVLVHDAARALTPPAVVRRVMATLEKGYDAVIPVIPVTDTIKVAGRKIAVSRGVSGLRENDAYDPGEAEEVDQTLTRSALRAVQTPQGFRTQVLRLAHSSAAQLSGGNTPASDDAFLVERIGRQVVMVPGDAEALKITVPTDFILAREILRGRENFPAAQSLPGLEGKTGREKGRG